MAMVVGGVADTPKSLTIHDKTKLLREYESSCYQITWFMLRNEEQAMVAAQQILLQLYENEAWFCMEDAARQAEVKQAALLYSLESKKKESQKKESQKRALASGGSHQPINK
ncbi:hypothetical protein [Paenibacillus agricola]|uniref:Uncharacterized protein n=1 Tax=Paenibacillus agricola TaxID=2716264 RepID=A0ABX0JGQ8_9BACL|nr:hypothetical protein [Paenibacillus agricola]NHN34570.1 hypothetical protein [Paenibacillus agricola]